MPSIPISDPAVQTYIIYSCALSLKMLAMTVLTSRQRIRKNVFANEEDAKIPRGTVRYDDQDVERVRRAHLNDLENIPVFWILGALYLTTAPATAWAITLFRVYAAGRMLHTFVYILKPLPQPARAFAFGVPFIITVYMGLKVIQHYSGAL